MSQYERVYAAFDRASLPHYMLDGLQRYLEQGIPPGSFMTAVLENDFINAACRADGSNRQCLHDWALFVYNHMPSSSWGNRAKVDAWMAAARARNAAIAHALATNHDGHDV